MIGLSEKILQTHSGNALIVAMDHGLVGGAYEGFKNPETTLDKILEGDPDGVMINPSFLHRFQEKLMARPNLKKVVSADIINFSTIPGKDDGLEIQDQLSNVNEIVRMGADAIKTLLVFGREDPVVFANNIKYVARVAEETRRFGIPFIVEPTLWGKKIEDKTNPELIEHAIRIAFELGADVIKAPYTGDEETFAPIVRNSPVPILILGGPKVETTAEVFEMVRGAMNVGARGVIFGRNIWQHEKPSGMIKAIKMIVHEGSSVESALKVL